MIRKIVLISAIIAASIINVQHAYAQEEQNEDGSFNRVDEKAESISGATSLWDHLTSNIKYPKEAKKAGIEGKVFVEFIISKSGEMTNIKVVKQKIVAPIQFKLGKEGKV